MLELFTLVLVLVFAPLLALVAFAALWPVALGAIVAGALLLDRCFHPRPGDRVRGPK